MKIFSRKPARPEPNGYSVIDQHLAISGDITTEGTVRVEGRIDGTLHRAHTLIIGAGGIVVGNVEALEVVVGGEVTGDLAVAGRVEVQKTGRVHGDIRGAAVMLEEGGTVQGHVIVHPIDGDPSQLRAIGGDRRLMLTPSRAMSAVSQG